MPFWLRGQDLTSTELFQVYNGHLRASYYESTLGCCASQSHG